MIGLACMVAETTPRSVVGAEQEERPEDVVRVLREAKRELLIKSIAIPVLAGLGCAALARDLQVGVAGGLLVWAYPLLLNRDTYRRLLETRAAKKSPTLRRALQQLEEAEAAAIAPLPFGQADVGGFASGMSVDPPAPTPAPKPAPTPVTTTATPAPDEGTRFDKLEVDE